MPTHTTTFLCGARDTKTLDFLEDKVNQRLKELGVDLTTATHTVSYNSKDVLDDKTEEYARMYGDWSEKGQYLANQAKIQNSVTFTTEHSGYNEVEEEVDVDEERAQHLSLVDTEA